MKPVAEMTLEELIDEFFMTAPVGPEEKGVYLSFSGHSGWGGGATSSCHGPCPHSDFRWHFREGGAGRAFRNHMEETVTLVREALARD